MQDFIQKLFDEGLISEESAVRLKNRYSNPLFSLSLELKTLLFSGIMLLTGGLGIVIYQNIDSIGHMAIILLIAALSLISFSYCYKNRVHYSNGKIESPSIFFEYVLLFGCLTLISFNGYLQYQYSVYGSANGVSFLLPAIMLFTAAYLFDHLGALSLAITCLAAFVGITITPISLLKENDFSRAPIIYSGIILGFTLVFIAWRLSTKDIKKHFTFTYFNFASHLLFVSCLSALFTFDFKILYFLLLSALVYLCIRYAIQDKSFYFLLIAVIYGYIGLSYCFILLISNADDSLLLPFGFMYFIGSSIYITLSLKSLRSKIKRDAHL